MFLREWCILLVPCWSHQIPTLTFTETMPQKENGKMLKEETQAGVFLQVVVLNLSDFPHKPSSGV